MKLSELIAQYERGITNTKKMIEYVKDNPITDHEDPDINWKVLNNYTTSIFDAEIILEKLREIDAL